MSRQGPNYLRIAMVLGAAILIGLAIWLLFIRDDDEGAAAGTGATAATQSDLANLASEVGHPIYWAGPRPPGLGAGVSYELTQTSDGRIYVRYLTPGAQVGDPRPTFLTIGTYPVGNGQAAIRRAARKSDANTERLSDGVLLLEPEARASHVYLAYPDSEYQIEVFDPAPGRALRLVSTGAIEPIGG